MKERNSKGRFIKGHIPYMEGVTALIKYNKEYIKGKPLSDKHREKISKSHKNVKLSEEHKENLRKNHKGMSGKKHNEETKKKIGKKNLGRRKKNAITRQKGYYTFKALERYARKLNAEGSHTFEEWIELKVKHNFTCVICKKSEPNIKLTQDHIIALTKNGSDFIDNIQPLCVSCNSRKGNR